MYAYGVAQGGTAAYCMASTVMTVVSWNRVISKVIWSSFGTLFPLMHLLFGQALLMCMVDFAAWPLLTWVGCLGVVQLGSDAWLPYGSNHMLLLLTCAIFFVELGVLVALYCGKFVRPYGADSVQFLSRLGFKAEDWFGLALHVMTLHLLFNLQWVWLRWHHPGRLLTVACRLQHRRKISHVVTL